MGLHLPSLRPLDPQQVPLPQGTEVVIAVDKHCGVRRVPQGAVGRVVRSDGDTVDVRVVGVGELRCARTEVVPRKASQLRYAQRRAQAWDALRPCVVLEATVGSRAWGLAEDGSDTDTRGVFMLPLPWTVGVQAPPRDLVSLDGSTTCWEAHKAVEQALRADPNTLEMLFVPHVRCADEMGAWLLEARDAFVSAEIYGSFGRYALSQLKKLEQTQRLYEHRAVVLQWLRDEPGLSLDGVAARLAPLTASRGPDAEVQAKQYVKQLYRSLHDQGLLPAADFLSLAAFARTEAADFDLPRELRPKNAYNLLRLILTATHWLTQGQPQLEVAESWKPRLRAIKAGAVPLPEVLRQAEDLAQGLDAARRDTRLPSHPDVTRADAVVRKMSLESARRWVRQEAGPWGAGSPPAPEVHWEERHEGTA